MDPNLFASLKTLSEDQKINDTVLGSEDFENGWIVKLLSYLSPIMIYQTDGLEGFLK